MPSEKINMSEQMCVRDRERQREIKEKRSYEFQSEWGYMEALGGTKGKGMNDVTIF